MGKVTVSINGYTDNLGSQAHGMIISEQRARTIESLLEQLGLGDYGTRHLPTEHSSLRGECPADSSYFMLGCPWYVCEHILNPRISGIPRDDRTTKLIGRQTKTNIINRNYSRYSFPFVEEI